MGDDSANDIFHGFLQQTDLNHIKPEHLRTMLKDFIVQERAALEPIIKANLKAQCMTYNDLVTFLSKSNTNGMDLTLKALSFMFKKAIMVIAEDYLWLSHTRPFENFDILYILFKGGQFASAPTQNGSLIHCELPLIKSLASTTDSCAHKVFDHKILNRSDMAKSQLVETCSEAKSNAAELSDLVWTLIKRILKLLILTKLKIIHPKKVLKKELKTHGCWMIVNWTL